MPHPITRLALAASLSLLVAASAWADPPVQGGSIIVAEGFSAPNDYDTSKLPPLFHDWCNNGDAVPECVPTVKLEVVDSKRGERLGVIYAWGQDFSGSADGVTLTFREFILYDLDGGEIFTISAAPGHPGGAFADPTLIPPKHGDVVLAGGAEGVVVQGTGKYAGAGGAYSTRLKVELDYATGFFVYYDELYFRFRSVRIEN
jgi:hypothetical protein